MNIAQISKKLTEVQIEELEKQTKFTSHADAQITAEVFLTSFFLMITKGHNTFSNWAQEVNLLIKGSLTDQAILAKMQFRELDFCKLLLEKVLKMQVGTQGITNISSKLLESFPRVFVEDSMCVKLPANLAEAFPGSYSKSGQAATGRIQCRLELKSGNILHAAIQSFRDNDQKFSPDILTMLQAGDLVIRDLGYWALEVFAKIADKSAFFLSRLKPGILLFNPDNQEEIALAGLLREAKKSNKTVVEFNALVGKAQLLPARIICIRVPAAVAQERRRKAKANRNQRVNYSEEYMELLDWTIFVTNVPPSVWTPQEMLSVYGFRWRIEILFKAWKSHFKFEQLFQGKSRLSAIRAEITLCLLLIWITLFFVKAFNFFLSEIYQRSQQFVSILKFAKFFKDHFEQFIDCSDWISLLPLIERYCLYGRKKKIPNFCQNLYSIAA